jgi:SPP1 gp7 family putative phage head morphogenesis protein
MPISDNQRNRIRKQLSNRRKTRPFKAPKYPAMIEMEYSKTLVKEVKKIDNLVKEILIPEIGRLTTHKEERFDAQFKNLSGIALATALIQKIRSAFYGEPLTEDSEPTQNLFTRIIKRTVQPFLERIKSKTEEQFVDEFERQTGTKPIPAQINVDEFIQDSLRNNVSLIKTIPQQYFEKLRQDVENAVRKGELSSTLREKIQDTSKASKNRARLIATDQIGKLTANIEEARQRKLGVTHYIWRTAQDTRVRSLANSNGYSDHKSLEGTLQKWSKPPVTVFKGKRAGERHHPGTDIRCRCNAQAVYDDMTGVDHPDTKKARMSA